MSHHELPFGAEILKSGEVRFVLRAPAAQTVELMLEDGPHAMQRGEDGLFALTTEATPGTRYRYRINADQEVPDPASRYQPDDVHGPSQLVDSESFEWRDEGWRGLPWEETVLYELHVGTFSQEGTFAGVKDRLDYLVDLGVTAIELMPLSDFPGSRNWGYDGVLPFAPDSAYGTPDDLKNLVQTAHDRGIMVFLDVVYNHFGPEGNYLPLYAPDFFTDRHETPWGTAINFDGEGSRWVREFFIHNALYWLEEFHIDGLRLDAIHAIHDDSDTHFLVELAGRVREGSGASRHVHLVLENDANQARYLRHEEEAPPRYNAQWNDDIHHAFHTTATGEEGGYYVDYADAPVMNLARCLTEGFAYQGEPSRHRAGERRGEPSDDLPSTSFVAFCQNHDQVGNRAFGERITDLAPPEATRAIAEIYLLSPQIPMMFMGEEWAASSPFPFFCDFENDLAPLVREGRREEFATFPEFSDPEVRERIPDPGDERTFRSAKLDWSETRNSGHREWLHLYRKLLELRREEIAPRLRDIPGGRSAYRMVDERGFRAQWRLGDGSILTLLANLGHEPQPGFEDPHGDLIYATEDADRGERKLPPWSVAWYLKKDNEGEEREPPALLDTILRIPDSLRSG